VLPPTCAEFVTDTHFHGVFRELDMQGVLLIHGLNVYPDSQEAVPKKKKKKKKKKGKGDDFVVGERGGSVGGLG
jgi:hypothetical protein